MKTISIGLRNELMQSAARLATCMRIQRTDGNVYGFTTNRKTLTIGGTFYRPMASFNPSDIASANNLDSDDVQIEGLLASAGVTEDDLRAGRWDRAAFRIFQINWHDLTQGDKKDRAGFLGETKVGRIWMAELLGVMESYSTAIGETTQAGCHASLGDQRCKFDLAGSPANIVTGTIDLGDTDFFTLTDAARAEPDGFFNEGILTIDFPGGPISYEVMNYLVGLWVTKTPVAYIATGMTYTMTRGCRRRFEEDCRDTFNNTANFRGQPHLRGPDALVQVGRRQ